MNFEKERYDSVTTVLQGSEIYIVYEMSRAYPEYLITYDVRPECDYW